MKYKIIKQTKNEIELEEIIDSRFTDNGDGTISDKNTGLMWPKDGSSDSMTWEEAEKYCKELRVGGFSDWRMPTREELESILDLTRKDPAINPLFNCKSEWYWSSTPYAGDSDFAWIVSFGYGFVIWNSSSSYYYVRPVRQY